MEAGATAGVGGTTLEEVKEPGRTYHPLVMTYMPRIIEAQYLFQRFLIQTRYGCKSESCTTPLCFSCRKRKTNPPTRRPSLITARLWAYSLACRRDAYSHLCPNEPTILPQQMRLRLSPEVERYLRDCYAGGEGNRMLLHNAFIVLHDGMASLRGAEGTDSELIRLNMPDNRTTVGAYFSDCANCNPDRKSLQQNIFATYAWSSWETAIYSNQLALETFRKLLAPSVPVFALAMFVDDDTKNQYLSRPNHYGPSKPAVDTSMEAVALGTALPGSGKDFVVKPSQLTGQQPYPKTAAQNQVPVLFLRNKKTNVPRPEGRGILFEELCSFVNPQHPSDFERRTTFQPASAFGTSTGLRSTFRDCYRNAEISHKELFLQLYALSLQSDISKHLQEAINSLFVPPPGWKSMHNFGAINLDEEYITDEDATHMLFISLLDLSCGMDRKILPEDSRRVVHQAIAKGSSCTERTLGAAAKPREYIPVILEIIDSLSNPMKTRLATRIATVIGARRAFNEVHNMKSGGRPNNKPMHQMLLDSLTIPSTWQNDQANFWSFPIDVADWLMVVALAEWDGNVTVNRWEPAGAALEFLNDMEAAKHRDRWVPAIVYIERRIPEYEAEWLLDFVDNPKRDPNFVSLLELPWLWSEGHTVGTFRAINYARMNASYRKAGYTESLTDRLYPMPDAQRFRYIHDKLEKASSRYLVLNVRREHLLEDALDSLWGRERRELMRPMKVRMGMDMGEAGVDQGGVSQEFFRLVFEKAFDPDAGLFHTTDENTHQAWFSPLAHEPLSTYQLLGLLVGLGVYNGITLPLSFPRALYKILRGLEIDYDDIENGWPSLYDSLGKLLAADYPIEDLSLDWTYTFEANGERHSIDMDKSVLDTSTGEFTMVPASESTRPLTSSNVKEYIERYVQIHVIETVTPQLRAFIHGVHTILTPRTLSVLTPSTLHRLTEGSRTINISELRYYTRYQTPYHSTHQKILWFWKIMDEFNTEYQLGLLKFVTASDRVPLGGYASLNFKIMSAGPGDSEMLPTSSTCFGHLYLPEYGDEGKMRRKLELALMNSIGFGSA